MCLFTRWSAFGAFFLPVNVFFCFFFSVSVAELQTHTELDSDVDGTFSDTEAQVYLVIFFLSFFCWHFLLFIITVV